MEPNGKIGFLYIRSKKPQFLFMNDWKTSFKGVSIYAKILEGLYKSLKTYSIPKCQGSPCCRCHFQFCIKHILGKKVKQVHQQYKIITQHKYQHKYQDKVKIKVKKLMQRIQQKIPQLGRIKKYVEMCEIINNGWIPKILPTTPTISNANHSDSNSASSCRVPIFPSFKYLNTLTWIVSVNSLLVLLFGARRLIQRTMPIVRFMTLFITVSYVNICWHFIAYPQVVSTHVHSMEGIAGYYHRKYLLSLLNDGTNSSITTQTSHDAAIQRIYIKPVMHL